MPKNLYINSLITLIACDAAEASVTLNVMCNADWILTKFVKKYKIRHMEGKMPKFVNFIKNLLIGIKITNSYQKERFIVNVDQRSSVHLKNIYKIPNEEKIIMVLDDSYFKNINKTVVFTDKKIYWNIKTVSLKVKQDNSKIKINGSGMLNNKMLANVSIFSKTEKDIKIIFIVSEDIQLIIPFVNFQIENSLTLAFYDYASNYSGGYKPDNLKNEKIYKNISKLKKIVKMNIIAKIFNGLSYITSLVLITNVLLQYLKNDIINNEIIICCIISFKIISIIFGNKKSMYSNLLLFILTYNILLIPREYNYSNYNIVYIIYAGIILLFSTFDFDKIFKFLIFILSITSLGYMIIKYLEIELLIKYIQ